MTRTLATRSFMIALVGLVSIGATACGSSSTSKSSSSPNDNGTTVTTTAATSGNGAGGGGGGVGASSDFCDTMQKDQAAFDGSGLDPSKSADQIKALYKDIVPKLETAEAQAPSAIKDDVATVVAAVKTLVSALDKANYDFTKLTPDALTSLNSSQLDTASQNITTYLAKNCGITSNP